MSEIGMAIAWLALSYAFQGVALPFTLRAFREQPTLGWGLSKILGLLMVGWAIWVLVSLHVLRYGPLQIWSVIGAAAAVTALWCRRTWPRERPAWTVGRRVETVYILSFGAYLAIRGLCPDIGLGEKLSDAMFLSAFLHDGSLPPADLWMAGQPINYYYFGYFLLATFAKALGTPVGIAYNLSLGLVFALSAAGLAALFLEWLQSAGVAHLRRWVLLALGLEFVIGNLATWGWFLFERHRVLANLGYAAGFGATRVITLRDAPEPGYVISEFPAFSFLFADLHPHLMAIPLSFAYLGGAYVLLTSVRLSPWFWPLMALVLGALGCLNTWEMPIAALVLGSAALAGGLWSRGWRLALGRGSLVLMATLLGAVAFAPFYRHFVPPHGAQGIQIGLSSLISTHSWLYHFGLFAFIGGSWLLMRASYLLRRHRADLRVWAPSLVVVLVIGSLTRSPLLALLCAGGLVSLYAVARESEAAPRYAAFLFGLACVLSVLADLANVHDRCNTIFKLFIPSWTLFALGSAFALRPLLAESRRGGGGWIWRACLLFFGFGSLAFPVLGTPFPSIYGTPWIFWRQGWHGLDGARFLASQSPDEVRAIGWLRQNPPGTLLELPGSIGIPGSSRLSVFAGYPTWVGWEDHEQLWHEGSPLSTDLSRRHLASEALFRSGDAAALRQVLQASNARYVVVSERERAIAHGGLEPLLASMLRRGFESPTLRIYEVPPERLSPSTSRPSEGNSI